MSSLPSFLKSHTLDFSKLICNTNSKFCLFQNLLYNNLLYVFIINILVLKSALQFLDDKWKSPKLTESIILMFSLFAALSSKDNTFHKKKKSFWKVAGIELLP